MAAARAILMCRGADLSLKPNSLPPLTQRLLIRHLLPSGLKNRSSIICLISGFDGGGVSDEFVSTRKSGFGREFSVIANMLKRIEPLDNSVISNGVSDSAKDSMKQTISTMLGLLPSDQFSVTVRVSKDPLRRIIDSSIVTGYTLWNAEYRMSLMRNFDMSPNSPRSDFEENTGVKEVRWQECNGGGGKKDGGGVELCCAELEAMSLQNFHDLSPEGLKYIQLLESELLAAKQELQSQTEEKLQLEKIKKNHNNLLQYLRSLEPDMVSELSRPSSPEVKEIIKELSQSILRRFFKDEIASDGEEYFDLGSMQNNEKGFETRDTICTSRDYLAKLLFWCMLLGHHLRGLENRLHLSCAVGLL